MPRLTSNDRPYSDLLDAGNVMTVACMVGAVALVRLTGPSRGTRVATVRSAETQSFGPFQHDNQIVVNVVSGTVDVDEFTADEGPLVLTATDTLTKASYLAAAGGGRLPTARSGAMSASTPIFNAGLVAPSFSPFYVREVWAYLDVTKYGLSHSSTADQQAGIEALNTIATAAGCGLYFPGHIASTKGYRHSSNITFTCPVIGDGPDDSIFLGTATAGNVPSVIQFSGTGLFAYGISARLESDVARNSSNLAHGFIFYQGCDDFWMAHCSVYNSAAAGFFIQGGRRMAFEDIYIADTMADGFHIRPGATADTQSIFINRYTSRGVGDDALAMVSYDATANSPDSYRIKGVFASNLDLRNGLANGRGIAVLGADDVMIDLWVVENPVHAGLYIGADGTDVDGRATQGSNRVRVTNGKLINTGGGSGNMAALHFRSTTTNKSTDITVEGLEITQPRRHLVYGTTQVADDITGLTIRGLKGYGNANGVDGMDLSGVTNLTIDQSHIENVSQSGIVIGATCRNVAVTDLTARNVNRSAGGNNDLLRFATSGGRTCTLGNISLLEQNTALERLVEVGSGWTGSVVAGTNRRANVKDTLAAGTASVTGYTEPPGGYIKTTYP